MARQNKHQGPVGIFDSGIGGLSVMRQVRRMLPNEDLIYIEGQKAYVTFHTSSKRVTALASLKDLEEKLPEKLFIRIHKSYIVSVKKIDSLEGNMIEIGGKHLPIGKSYKKDVETLFGLNN